MKMSEAMSEERLKHFRVAGHDECVREIRRLGKANERLTKKLARATKLIEGVCGEELVSFESDKQMRRFLGWKDDE